MTDPATIATVLASMVARDLADDLVRAVTFGAGYRPTVGVMVQRHWAEQRERIESIAGLFRGDVRRDGHHVAFSDNRDLHTCLRDLEMLAARLRAEGFRVRISRHVLHNLAVELEVHSSKASIEAVMDAAPLYIARIDAAMAMADAA